MIQRVQSLFLILVDLVLVVLLFVPYAYVTPVVEMPATRSVTLLDVPPLLVGQIIICMLAVVTLTLFRKRALQMKFCVAGMLVSLLYSVFLAYYSLFPLIGAHWEIGPGTYISLANVLLFFLARVFIRKDEELVKSVDRLR